MKATVVQIVSLLSSLTLPLSIHASSAPAADRDIIASPPYHHHPGCGAGRPCGFRIAPCPKPLVCSHFGPGYGHGEVHWGICIPPELLPSSTPSPASTAGATPTASSPVHTATYQSCGGFRVEPVFCPDGYACVDDPYVGGCGMACDAPGICVKPEFCGGLAAIPCEDVDKACFDDPRDDCDPLNGGADCGGICI